MYVSPQNVSRPPACWGAWRRPLRCITPPRVLGCVETTFVGSFFCAALPLPATHTRLHTQVNDKLDKQDAKQDTTLQKQDATLQKLDEILAHQGASEMRESEPVLTHATIPPEVPELPAALQTRPALLDEMKQRVLRQSQSASTTSLVGVSRGAATTSAHGMVTRARTHTRARARIHPPTHTQ